MQSRGSIRVRLAHLAKDYLISHVASKRAPDRFIGGKSNPYMKRWYIWPRNRICNAYLHQFLRSDDDRALHDHPWVNMSFILSGEYIEHLAGDLQVRRSEGQLAARLPTTAHRVELDKGACWTLFMTGPHWRQWGFLCPQGWRHWKDFSNKENPDEPGPGCD